MDNPPANPWSVLGLEAASATEREVKRAYARLVKEHRPETDPSGFQRIHQAYQLALEWVRQPGPRIQPEEIAEETPADPPEIAPNSPIVIFREGLSLIQRAIREEDATALNLSMDQLRRYVHSEPYLCRDWEQALIELFSDDLAFLASRLMADDLYFMIYNRCEVLPIRIITEWHGQGFYSRLEQLASLLLDYPPPFEHEPTEVLQAWLAGYVAFVDFAKAESLTNRVYPKIPPQGRDWFLSIVEPRLAAAKIFQSLPEMNRLFWEKRLFPNGDETMEWTDEEMEREFASIQRHCPPQWPGFALLERSVPSQVYGKFARALTKTVRTTGPRKFWYGGVLGWIFWGGPPPMNVKAETVKAICFGLAVALILVGNYISDHNKRVKEQPASKMEVEFPFLTNDQTEKFFESSHTRASEEEVGNEFLFKSEVSNEVAEAVNLATDPAQFPKVQELMRGNTRYFKPKSEKHVCLLTKLYHSEECPINVRTTAISCLNEFYSSSTCAEILIHLVKTQPGDVLIQKDFTKFQAKMLLEKQGLSKAHTIALLKIARS
jgi:hypothetical protein